MTQHKDSAIMTQLQLRNWLIDREIELLSTRHDLDRGRVRAILEKTYDDTYAPSLEGFSTPFTSSTVGELLQSNLDSFFTPSLRDAIKHMEPESALSLFEQSMPKLTKQLLIFDYLTDVTIPYRTLNELQQFTQTALNYLERNREAILLTGEGTSRISSLRWPAFEVSDTYFVKSATRFYIVSDFSSTGIPSPRRGSRFELFADRSGLRWSDASGRPCSFEEADIMGGLDPVDASQLDQSRRTILDLKASILSELDDALTTRSTNGLWENCLRHIICAVTGDEADFLLRMDRWYAGYDVRTGEVIDHEAGINPGGLALILELIGHYEKELTIGTMSRTKLELSELGLEVEPDAGVVGDIAIGSGADLYYKSIAAGQAEELDSVLERFLKREEQERHFWEEFRDRVNTALAEEFYTDVIVRTKVKRKHVPQFEPTVRLFAEMERAKQEFTDTGHTSATSLPGSIDARSENEFRKVGDYWDITYQRGEPVRLKDSKGLRYIAYLVRTPGKEYHAVDLAQIIGEVRTASEPIVNTGSSNEPVSI